MDLRPRSFLLLRHVIPMDSTKLNSKVKMPAETLAILADINQEINASLNLDEVLANAAALRASAAVQ